jgi:hypothetical protein
MKLEKFQESLIKFLSFFFSSLVYFGINKEKKEMKIL